MIVGNLYFIKNTNGLFYYGVDYIQDQRELVREILVRPALENAARAMFPGIPVVVCCNVRKLWTRAWAARGRGDVLYTPTSHPLPFINQQWIVVHDAYPFLAEQGRIKRHLLCLSLALSRCRVAYINESETLPFVKQLGVPSARLLFAPNKVKGDLATRRPAREIWGPLKVGLVGTDSPKKRYDELLAAVSAAGLQQAICFHVYGHRTPYFQQVSSHFPDSRLELYESDRQSLQDFLDGIDLLVSVADLEGFGRPIAAALMAGIPCYLLKKPVFQEFFTTAHFFDDTGKLVKGLADAIANGLPEETPYAPPLRVREGYRDSSNQLRSAALAAAR